MSEAIKPDPKILKRDDLILKYNTRVKVALELAHSYEGRQDQHENLYNELDSLEKWIGNIFDVLVEGRRT